MRPVRVLLVGLPRLMCDILEGAVTAQTDMQLVGQCEHAELERAARDWNVDVIIVGEQDHPEDDRHRRLLLAHPRLRVVVMARDGGCADLMQFRRVRLPDPSPATLLEAIRAAVHDHSW